MGSLDLYMFLTTLYFGVKMKFNVFLVLEMVVSDKQPAYNLDDKNGIDEDAFSGHITNL